MLNLDIGLPTALRVLLFRLMVLWFLFWTVVTNGIEFFCETWGLRRDRHHYLRTFLWDMITYVRLENLGEFFCETWGLFVSFLLDMRTFCEFLLDMRTFCEFLLDMRTFSEFFVRHEDYVWVHLVRREDIFNGFNGDFREAWDILWVFSLYCMKTFMRHENIVWVILVRPEDMFEIFFRTWKIL